MNPKDIKRQNPDINNFTDHPFMWSRFFKNSLDANTVFIHKYSKQVMIT